MLSTCEGSQSIWFPVVREGAFFVSILHRGRWHETEQRGTFEEVLQTAMDAHRRSGLVVQLRDEEGVILYEANEASDDSAGN